MRPQMNIAGFATQLQAFFDGHDYEVMVYDDPSRAYGDGVCIPYWAVCFEPAVTLCVYDMALQNFALEMASWHSYPHDQCEWTFRVDEEMVLGQVDGSTGDVTELFPVESAREVFDIIDFLLSAGGVGAEPAAPVSVDVPALIADMYVPFFRFPDDVDLKDSGLKWTRVAPLKALLREHFEQGLEWMAAPKSDARRNEHRESMIRKRRDGKEHTITVSIGEDTEEMTSSEFVLAFIEADYMAKRELKWRYFEVASSIREADVLPDEQMVSTVSATLWYGGCCIPVRIQLSAKAYGPYFRKEFNPDDYRAVTAWALASLRGNEGSLEPQCIQVPSLAVQKRVAFETARYRHALTQLGRRLDDLESGCREGPGRSANSETCAAATRWRAQLRYESVTQLMKEPPDEASKH